MSDEESERKRAAAGVVRHLAAMARQRREEHEAAKSAIEPHGIEALIAKRKRGAKITSLEVGQWLAVVKRAHEHFGERDAGGELADVRIPFASLDVIGEVVLGRTNWQRRQAREQKGKARKSDVRALWNATAAKYFLKNSRLSKHDVAKRVSSDMERLYREKIAAGEAPEVAEKVRGRPGTIRRAIQKTRKLSSAVR
jgi:hypothetical protein